MGYKEKLGINRDEYIFNEKIDDYFKSIGFYVDTMHPRFMNGYDYDKLILHEPVLRHDSVDDNSYTIRVFMNRKCIYVEIQTSYRSLEGTKYISLEDVDYWEATPYDIEKYLDDILK